MEFNPLAHKGNVVSYFTSTIKEKAPVPSLLTSFPAFQGASGAPVIWANRDTKEFSVVGMITGNVETELQPAQTIRIEEEDGSFDETKFFHRFGRAFQL